MSIWQRLLIRVRGGIEPMGKMISPNGMVFLREVEGWQLMPYNDEGCNLTIGCGHKLTFQELNTGLIELNGRLFAWRGGLTDDQVRELKDKDSRPVEAVINKAVLVPLSDNQFDALASFIFNAGVNAFSKSGVQKRLNAADYSKVPAELSKWIYMTDKRTGEKRKTKGLQNRRDKEISLWNGLWKSNQ